MVRTAPATRKRREECHLVVPKEDRQFEIIEQMLDPQAVKAFAVQAIEQTDEHDIHQPRPRADCMRALFESMPHVLPCVAVFAGRGMKTCFGHDEHKRDANQHHTQRADLNGQGNVICANEHG